MLALTRIGSALAGLHSYGEGSGLALVSNGHILSADRVGVGGEGVTALYSLGSTVAISGSNSHAGERGKYLVGTGRKARSVDSNAGQRHSSYIDRDSQALCATLSTKHFLQGSGGGPVQPVSPPSA